MRKAWKRKSDIASAFYARDGPIPIIPYMDRKIYVADPASGGTLRRLP